MADFMAVALGSVMAAGVTLAFIGPPGSRVVPATLPAASVAPHAAAVAPVSAPAPTPASLAGAVARIPPAVSLPTSAAARSQQPAWVVPDVDALPDDEWGRTVRHGRDLIARTYALIGPEAPDASRRFAGNNLACQNCHLEAGTKRFGLPFQGVYADLPNYRARSGTVATVEDHIQDCMTRSMNGKPLPAGSPEMTAIVAYMKSLSDGRVVGAPTTGRGAGHMAELTRAADPALGKDVYAENCTACHGADGAGQRAGAVGNAQGYTYPPLWGDDSFNDGAGMARLIGAANFIHGNMPNGVSWHSPALSEQDAWDVAAYVQSQPRPREAHLDHDYPVALERPVDSNYGPYVDGISAEQHKLGPFAPIRARMDGLRATAPLLPASPR